MKRKITVLMLVFALMIGISYTGGTDTAKAAKSKKLTMLTNETIPISFFGDSVKSAKSSKTSVIKVKKAGSNKVNFTSKKKAGKATVTITSKRGSVIRYYVTVKKAKFTTECDIRVSQTASGKYSSTVAFRVVNKSGVFIQDAEVLYALIDQNGTTVEQKSFKVYDLVPGATVYKTVSFDIQDTYVAAATGGVQTWTRNPSYKYTNMTKKVNIKMTSQTESSMSFTFKNKSKKTVNGTADLLFLDAEGKILFIRQMSFYLQPKATSTDTAGYIPEGTVSTKLVKRAYAKDYVG